MDEKGWNNEEAIAMLCDNENEQNHPYQKEVISRLSQLTNQPISETKSLFRMWQQKQRKLNSLREKQKQKEKQLAKDGKKEGMVPLWRCGVCGRADQPFIACYVQPFIVRYELRPLN